MSRNQERVLSDAMIFDIKKAIYTDLKKESEGTFEMINVMMHCYLTNDWDNFKQFTTEVIETYEDEIIATLNMEIREDLENQNENHDNA